ncbi:MAG: superoxide dismutase family protein [Thermodesulfobacteriota bacterium]
MRRASWFWLVSLWGALAWPAAGLGAPSAVGELVGLDGKAVGTVEAREGPGGLLIAVTAAGLPPGAHGFHLHAVGECVPPFSSAGGHFSPTGRKHGLLSSEGPHLGDLPNVHVAPDGTLRVETFAPGVILEGGPHALLDADGASVVLHEGPDDHRTDPAGGAGARIACAVLRRGP